jgi:hypothetical protein
MHTSFLHLIEKFLTFGAGHGRENRLRNRPYVYQAIFHEYAGSVTGFAFALNDGAVAAEEAGAATFLAGDFKGHFESLLLCSTAGALLVSGSAAAALSITARTVGADQL